MFQTGSSRKPAMNPNGIRENPKPHQSRTISCWRRPFEGKGHEAVFARGDKDSRGQQTEDDRFFERIDRCGSSGCPRPGGRLSTASMALGKLHATGGLVVVAIVALILLNLYFLSGQKDHDFFIDARESLVRSSRGAPMVPKYLILVLSKRGNVERRQAIRETWAKTYRENFGWKTRFVVGRDATEGALGDEHLGDVLEVNVIESYLSLVDKLQKAFGIVLDSEKFQYVIKVDDDVYLNLRPFLEAEDSDPPKGNILGHAIFGSMASTDPVDKYFSEAHASQKAEFPSFASGTGYLMSKETLAAIVRRWYCRSQLGMHLVDDRHFGFQRRLVLPCNVRQFAVVHNLTAGNLRYVHEMLNLEMKGGATPGPRARRSPVEEAVAIEEGMEPILIAAILFGALLIALSIVGSFYVYRYTMNRERIHQKTGSSQSSRGAPTIVTCEEGKHEGVRSTQSAAVSLQLPGQISEARSSPRHSCVNEETRVLGVPSGFRQHSAEIPRPASNNLHTKEDPGVRRKSSAALYEAQLLGIGAPPMDVQSEQEEIERQKRKNMMIL
ncbi:hypothetical protein QR680_017114 [Steinernema hermaphroditum]|uniref:Hexosyltransferase n=1 Tax=Steinernema hermaphroditum TaxID=289476 RepID=A0AA39HDC1_9BILA|nr:hypothetical protein QR680_017114 [Steinernema hermaphroditum]